MRRLIAGALGAIIAGAALLFWPDIATWLQGAFGFRAGAGNSPQYLFWSGAGSDLAYLSVFAASFGYYRKINCRKAGCWRIGRHELTDPTDGVTRMLCARHHPAVRHRHLNAEQIMHIHRKGIKEQVP